MLYYTPTLVLENHIEELQSLVFQFIIDHDIEQSIFHEEKKKDYQTNR